MVFQMTNSMESSGLPMGFLYPPLINEWSWESQCPCSATGWLMSPQKGCSHWCSCSMMSTSVLPYIYIYIDYIETNLISVHESGPLSKSLPQYYNRPAMSDLNDVGMPPVFFWQLPFASARNWVCLQRRYPLILLVNHQTDPNNVNFGFINPYAFFHIKGWHVVTSFK